MIPYGSSIRWTKVYWRNRKTTNGTIVQSIHQSRLSAIDYIFICIATNFVILQSIIFELRNLHLFIALQIHVLFKSNKQEKSHYCRRNILLHLSFLNIFTLMVKIQFFLIVAKSVVANIVLPLPLPHFWLRPCPFSILPL